jgi:hypothetical protein
MSTITETVRILLVVFNFALLPIPASAVHQNVDPLYVANRSMGRLQNICTNQKCTLHARPVIPITKTDTDGKCVSGDLRLSVIFHVLSNSTQTPANDAVLYSGVC